jgi:hypothetical protein
MLVGMKRRQDSAGITMQKARHKIYLNPDIMNGAYQDEERPQAVQNLKHGALTNLIGATDSTRLPVL